MAVWGLIFIVAGWLVQLVSVWFLQKEINRTFIIFCSIGAFFLVIDGFLSGMITIASLNAAVLILSFLILIKIKK